MSTHRLHQNVPPGPVPEIALRPVRFGVIGAEGRGVVATAAHAPEKGRWLTAACTLHPERIAGELKARCGPDFLLTRDPYELLARRDLDAVFICTPDFLHEEHTLAAIDAGKSVYLEKPMAITIEGCDRIMAQAEKKGVKVYVGHNMRFFAAMLKMKELVDAGRIGRLQAIWCRHFVAIGGDAYFKDWHSERRHTHGLLLQKGAHDLDVIHWLARAYTSRVVGMGKLSVYNQLPRREAGAPAPVVKIDRRNWPPTRMTGFSPEIDVEDHNMLLLQLANGVQASYTQCHYTPDNHRNYTLIGTEGRIENHGCVSTPDHWASVHLWNRRTGYSEVGHEVFRIPHAEGGHGGSDPLVFDDFFSYLQGDRAAGASLLDARMAVAAAYLGTQSLRTGSLPFDVCQP
ncbi:MAG TPA: Gfo/Idh/MocA family oxidoreductase [Chthoniobacteraceae bacterium]|nr:Gfo/Idh/MocA family oxidoreductase [Chthoniobacteraceae bacterium]